MKKFIRLNDTKNSVIRVDNIQSISSEVVGNLSFPIWKISILFNMLSPEIVEYRYKNECDMLKDKANIENILIEGEF